MEKESNKPEVVNNPEELQHYIIKGRLDLSQIKELDRDMPLNVAAVRSNRVLRSEIIDIRGRKDVKAIDFEMEFQLPGRRRCGVHLVVSRGDIKEADILGVEGVRQWIPANHWKERTAEHNPFIADIGSVVIQDKVYKHWLIFCRRYTIRGRVVCRRWFYDPIEQQWVFMDNPVPGATVEAYDVDCWWWWCFKDMIKTAVTDVNGYFEMNFIWCCRSWFPFRAPWIIDPDLLRRIRETLAKAKLPFGPILPDPPPDPCAFRNTSFALSGA